MCWWLMRRGGQGEEEGMAKVLQGILREYREYHNIMTINENILYFLIFILKIKTWPVIVKNGFVVTILIQIAKGMTFLRTLDKLLIPPNLNISTFERQQIIVLPPGSRGKNCIGQVHIKSFALPIILVSKWHIKIKLQNSEKSERWDKTRNILWCFYAFEFTMWRFPMNTIFFTIFCPDVDRVD